MELNRRNLLGAVGGLAAFATAGCGYQQEDDEMTKRIGTPKHGHGGDGDGGGDLEPLEERYRQVKITDNSAVASAVNSAVFTPRLKTYNGKQYFSYLKPDAEIVIGSRDLETDAVTLNQTGILSDSLDPHWAVGLGIGPGGHIFICYNTRSSDPTWRRSTNPEDVTAFDAEQLGMTGQNESSANYPEFTRLSDGTLLFGYRNGSNTGNWNLNRWDPDAGSWEALQHSLTDGEAARRSYHWNLLEDEAGRLHYFFCWRDDTSEKNSKLSYARSPDGGESWETSSGTTYNLPITKSEAEEVDPAPESDELFNQGWAAYDPRNDRPHVAYLKQDADGNTQIFHAYDDGNGWQTEAVTRRDSAAVIGENKPVGRPAMVVGDTGNVYILVRDWFQGGWPLLLEKSGDSWDATALYNENLNQGEFQMDLERWQSDRVFSVMMPKTANGATSGSTDEDYLSGGGFLHVTDIDVQDGIASLSPRAVPSDRMIVSAESAAGNDGAYSTTSTALSPITGTFLSESAYGFGGTPLYARMTVRIAIGDSTATATARLRVRGTQSDGSTFTDAFSAEVTRTGATTTRLRSTGWVKVPEADSLRFVSLLPELKTSNSTYAADITGYRLELAYPNPVATLDGYVQ